MSSSLVNNKAQTKANNRKFSVRLKEKKAFAERKKKQYEYFSHHGNFHYVRSITIFPIYRVPILFSLCSCSKIQRLSSVRCPFIRGFFSNYLKINLPFSPSVKPREKTDRKRLPLMYLSFHQGRLLYSN